MFDENTNFCSVYINGNLDLKVLKELPKDSERVFKFYAALASVDNEEDFKEFHYCEKCDGWIEESPIRHKLTNFEAKTAKNGVGYFCARCGNNIGFFCRTI